MITIKTTLQQALKNYYADDVPAPEASARGRTLRLVEAEAARGRTACELARVPFWRFVVGQLRFASRWAWALQVALLTCMFVLVGELGAREGSAMVVMGASVLSVAIGAPSVFKSFETGVSELEYSCRFNCVQVLASRLVLFGLADVLWITLAVAVVPGLSGVDAMRVFLYASTPFFCACAISFFVARRTRGSSGAVGIVPAVVVVVALWLANAAFPAWYANLSLATWTVAFIASTALAAFEMRRLVRDVSAGLAPRAGQGA